MRPKCNFSVHGIKISRMTVPNPTLIIALRMLSLQWSMRVVASCWTVTLACWLQNADTFPQEYTHTWNYISTVNYTGIFMSCGFVVGPYKMGLPYTLVKMKNLWKAILHTCEKTQILYSMWNWVLGTFCVEHILNSLFATISRVVVHSKLFCISSMLSSL